MFVTIVHRPIGEAPDWVRDAWIGLRLPVADLKRKNFVGVGVISGPHNFFLQVWRNVRGRTVRISGYSVNAKAAVDLLSEANPSAAEWWRQNASKLLDGRRNFVFDENACEP